jgi:acyl-CoA synthetase (AMP-forming)/AMP-acid ligase II
LSHPWLLPKGEAKADELIAYVAERLAQYKKIRFVEVIDQIPKSTSGKILRRVLIKPDRAGASQSQRRWSEKHEQRHRCRFLW